MDGQRKKPDELAFNGSLAIRLCRNYTSLTYDPWECIEDIRLTGSDKLVQSHLESFKISCRHFVEIRPELKDKGPNDAKSIFDTIMDSTCPKDCNNKGTCREGVCVCDAPFGGADCTTDLSKPPEIRELHNGGLCDLKKDKCTEQVIMGDRFVDSDNLKCRMTSYTMDADGNMLKGSIYYTKAVIHHFEEIACRIPTTRVKKSAGSTKLQQATGFLIAVSNDGVVYSKNNIMVIYNSECQKCSVKGSSVSCITMSSFCVAQSQCIHSGDFYPGDKCLICENSGWTTFSDCKEKEKPYWVIGVVVAVCILIGVVLFILLKNKNRAVHSAPPYSTEIKQSF